MTRTALIMFVAAGFLAGCRGQSDAARAAERMVDLGHPLAAGDPSWEGPPALERRVVATFEKDGYSAGQITVEEHFGTHLDAPSHFARGGWTVDAIPVDRLNRSGVVIDVSDKVQHDVDYRVTVDDVEAFEKRVAPVPEGSIVLIATGWDKSWPDRRRYMNEINGVKHFPGLSPEAVGYLVNTRRVVGIGIDTPSIDHGPSTSFEAHRVSMAQNVYHIENAAGLTALPSSGFRVIVAPINIAGGSGGPTRVFALLP